jgi:YVTN family beta-propeller protein
MSTQPFTARPLMLAAFVPLGLAALLTLSACQQDEVVATSTSKASASPGVTGGRMRAQALVVNANNWVAITPSADPLLQGLSIPATAPTQGMWSAVQNWPLNGLHVAVLPQGKVLSFGTNPDGGQQNGRYYDVWDPALGWAANSHVTTYRAEQQDSFCAGATYMADGRLMISGGNGSVTTTVYSPQNDTVVTDASSLADQRWYATMLTLPDGRPLMLGGMVPYTEGMQDNPDTAVAQGLASMTPEVYEGGAWRSLLNAYSRDAFGPDYLRASYPRAWVAPSGKVFGISAERMWTLDPSDNGSLLVHGAFKTAPDTTVKPNVGATNTAVMYDIGKILLVGGNGSFNGDGLPASVMATQIDINGPAPVLTEQPAMAHARRFGNAVVLPDGKVLITGGTRQGNSNGANAVLPAEIWNPVSGTWSTAASAAVYRGYHSFTVLLPNGTVLSTGGGTPGPVTNLNAELYYPPQLFRTVNGTAQLAPRPVIGAISGLSHAHGGTLQLDLSSTGTIQQLVLIGLGNGTHSFNPGQRRIPLAFTQDSIRLTTTLPDARLAPPGYYQLVVIDSLGVPSRATVIALGQGLSAPPVSTTPYNPPDLSSTPISAPIIAAGGTASYSYATSTGVTYSWSFGDGSADTAFSATANVSHTFAAAGVYTVTLTARSADGALSRRTFVQAVATAATAKAPTRSSAMALEARATASARLWVVNPDNNSVSVIDTASNARVAEIAVGNSPRSVAVAPDGRIWVVNKGSATISIINASTLAVVQTVSLARASQPHGLAFAPSGAAAYVTLEGLGRLLKLSPSNGSQQASLTLGANVRHLSVTADSNKVLVTRFISPSVSGEGTATVNTAGAGGDVLVVTASTLALSKTIKLAHSSKTDTEIQGAGLPNYLAAATISPDGLSAWTPSKQDNIQRGTLRNGQNLNFQNTVRAISSRVNLSTMAEELARRIDHDNASLASAAAFHPSGAYLYVTLETSREVAVVDAINGRELFRIDVGLAPQDVLTSADGKTLYVHNFMDRTVSVVNLSPLVLQGELRASVDAITPAVAVDKLDPVVLRGKQLFYDARDTRLARDRYMSCASCHNDAGHDGRVWDFTGMGEGLRNTTALNGRAGTGHGLLHWSGNFDEVQDFERQIRDFAGGTGLMADADYLAGTRSQPLGDRKAGLSSDLDALAAYLESLSGFAPTPYRGTTGALTTAASSGKTVFRNAGCANCHTGNGFTNSPLAGGLKAIGTIKASSGKRLGATLSGLDVPSLRDVWATAPYLHDGSAATLAAAVQAHSGNTVSGTNLSNLVAYLQQIGNEEAAPTGSITVSNLAPTATLATSFVSAWESLAAVNNNITPTNSADKNGGAYGNWDGEANYGRTDWVSFTWTGNRNLSALEVYWWADGQGVALPTTARVEYWDGQAWQALAPVGLKPNQFNRVAFTNVVSTRLRVSMRSAMATGILEVRSWGHQVP